MVRQLWLDCDGVLADFTAHCLSVLGCSFEQYSSKYGEPATWQAINRSDKFFEVLPLMADARQLVSAVEHLRPIILTGTPRGDAATIQKLRWRDKHFPGIPMVTCKSAHKCHYCKPGDILIDDFTKYKHLWEQAGGTFIVHTSAADSIAQLKQLGVL